MSESTMTSMGALNDGWGICGFTSTFYAMYRANPATRGWLVNATEVYSVLYEICDYLKSIQIENPKLVRDIEKFTRSFGGIFEDFEVASYITRVETLSEGTRQILAFGSEDFRSSHDAALRKHSPFSIAMPPQAIVDYIERLWKWKATLTEFTSASFSDDAIVGVRNKTRKDMKMYHGLCHYLYRGNGQYYSWGRSFPSLQAANPDYEICYAITIRKY